MLNPWYFNEFVKPACYLIIQLILDSAEVSLILVMALYIGIQGVVWYIESKVSKICL